MARGLKRHFNLNRNTTIATNAKTTAISPATTQNPIGLRLKGMPPTFAAVPVVWTASGEE